MASLWESLAATREAKPSQAGQGQSGPAPGGADSMGCCDLFRCPGFLLKWSRRGLQVPTYHPAGRRRVGGEELIFAEVSLQNSLSGGGGQGHLWLEMCS